METATDTIRRAAIEKAARTRAEARVALDSAGKLIGLPFKLLGRPSTRLVERRSASAGLPAGTLLVADDAPPASAEVHHFTAEWVESKRL
ncbi:MAG: hypothetical protein AAFQ43_05625, partial [Bacteroidota bacterium]